MPTDFNKPIKTAGKCPSCGGAKIFTLTFEGRDYPQCAECKFWTTKVEATWQPKIS